MPIFILRLSVAILAFLIGVGTNAFVNRIGDRFISQRSATFFRAENHWHGRSWLMPGAGHWRSVVVTVADDQSVYVGAQEAGTLDNAQPLRERLMRIRAWDAQRQADSWTSGDRSYSSCHRDVDVTVYVQSAAVVPYEKLGKLLETIKETGANRIELITASRLVSID
jgi:biopolymer transport protein ExbD